MIKYFGKTDMPMPMISMLKSLRKILVINVLNLNKEKPKSNLFWNPFSVECILALGSTGYLGKMFLNSNPIIGYFYILNIYYILNIFEVSITSHCSRL